MNYKLLKINLIIIFFITLFAHAESTKAYPNFYEKNIPIHKHKMDYYGLKVFKGDNYKVKINQLSADIDLYVKLGSKPTKKNYDCRPFHGGQYIEECTTGTITEDTTLYIGIYSTQSAQYNLRIKLKHSTIKEMDYDKETFSIVAKDLYRHYKIKAKEGDKLRIKAYNLDKNGDLFVNFDSKASSYNFDKKSTSQNNKDEEILIDIPYDMDVYISLLGIENCVEHKILITRVNEPDDITVLNSAETESDSVKYHEWRYFKIHALAGESVLSVLDALSDDADLYLKVGEKPTRNNYDKRSIRGGTSEDTARVSLDQDADVYIGIYGYRAASFNIRVDVVK